MALQAGHNIEIYYQVQPGSTIPSGGIWLPFGRSGGNGFGLSRGDIPDETITRDSQQVDTIAGNNDVAGSFDTVLRPGYGNFFESVLKADFSGSVSSSSLATIAFTAASGSTLATVSNLPDTPAAGDCYILSGAVAAGNNGAIFVKSVATGTASVIGQPIVTAAAGASITATKLSSLSKGSGAAKKFTFVEEFPQAGFNRVTEGVVVESIEISAEAGESLATASYTMTADSQTAPTGDPIGDAGGTKSNVSVTARQGFVHYKGAFRFNSGTTTLSTISMTIGTPREDVYIFGDRNKFGTVDGITVINGSMDFVLNDKSEYDAFLADMKNDLVLSLKEFGQSANDGVGDMVFVFPRATLTSPSLETPAEGPATLSFDFSSTIGGDVTKSVSVFQGS